MPCVLDPAQLTDCMLVFSVLVFQSSTTGRTFQIEYPSITLHAISRGESGPFVYCQLDDSPVAGADGGDGGADADAEDLPRMRELSLTPQPSDSRAYPLPPFSPPRLTLNPSACSQWTPFSRRSLSALLFTPIPRGPTTRTPTRMRSSIVASLKSSPVRRAKSSAKSEGCAVISSTITAISPTRRLLPPLSLSVSFFCVYAGCARSFRGNHLRPKRTPA
jgi:hypothetical protein